jgi:hypothetical protein
VAEIDIIPTIFFRAIYELCISFPENHTMPLLKNIAQLFFDSAVEIRKVKIFVVLNCRF